MPCAGWWQRRHIGVGLRWTGALDRATSGMSLAGSGWMRFGAGPVDVIHGLTGFARTLGVPLPSRAAVRARSSPVTSILQPNHLRNQPSFRVEVYDLAEARRGSFADLAMVVVVAAQPLQ